MTLIRTNDGFRSRSLIPGSIFSNDFFLQNLPSRSWMEGNGGTSQFMPAANVMEDKKRFLIELSTPGYAKDDFLIEIDDRNMLTVTGTHEDEINEDTEFYSRREFTSGSFTRSFQLPEMINDTAIIARYFDGVLMIELPKIEPSQRMNTTKEIKIT